MINILRYQYGFIEPVIKNYDNKIYVFENDNKYLIQKINNENSVNVISMINKIDKMTYKLLETREKKKYFLYYGCIYVLLIVNKYDHIKSIFREIQVNNNELMELKRDDWYTLWINKIDYIEKELNSVIKQNKTLNESLDYFIGLSETAIEYSKKEKANLLYICKKRIIKNDINNPLNIVIDKKERDIGEYLKYIFFENQFNLEYVKKIIQYCKKKKYDSYLILSRMLFPSYYFDLIDKIINMNEDEYKIRNIINNITKYEEYISFVQQELNVKDKIKWTKKD